MKSNWEFAPHRVVILYCAALILGGEIAMLTTNNVGLFGGLLQICAMILITIVVVISSRKNETKQ